MQDDGGEVTLECCSSFISCAPCRLCLFGEHQDYLGLPSIALSIPLYCRIKVETEKVENGGSRVIILKVPALHKTMHYNLDNLPPRQAPGSTEPPDFALAAIHEALNDGWNFEYVGTCVSTIDDEMPMQAGCSTSSAFCVAWIQALACLAGRRLTPLQLARRAHQAEVQHFQAPGGTMDHITCALGGLLRIGPDPWEFVTLPHDTDERLGVWILAYSGEPKDTLGHLWRCKDARLALLEKLGGDWDADHENLLLSKDECELLHATRVNRDTESEAFQTWTAPPDAALENSNVPSNLGNQLGILMMKHHEALRDGLHLSTPKLEALNKAAMNAGAWGFKLVGSGGGGCGVAWSSVKDANSVSRAMKANGAPLVWAIRSPSLGAHITK